MFSYHLHWNANSHGISGCFQPLPRTKSVWCNGTVITHDVESRRVLVGRVLIRRKIRPRYSSVMHVRLRIQMHIALRSHSQEGECKSRGLNEGFLPRSSYSSAWLRPGLGFCLVCCRCTILGCYVGMFSIRAGRICLS